MPQSLSLVIVHIIFSTKERQPFLDPETRPKLHAYLATGRWPLFTGYTVTWAVGPGWDEAAPLALNLFSGHSAFAITRFSHAISASTSSGFITVRAVSRSSSSRNFFRSRCTSRRTAPGVEPSFTDRSS